MNTRIQAQTRGSSFRPLGIFCGLGLLIFSNLAATPEPPVLFFAGDNTNRIEAILGKYTRPSNLTALQYPADPVTTTTHEVRTNSELAAAVGGDGRLIRIYGPSNGGQATYSQFNLSNRSDIDIVMDNDATITGGSGWAWWGPVRRIRWTGGNIALTSGGNGLQIPNAEDLLMDDVQIYKTSGNAGMLLFLGASSGPHHQRVALINSTMRYTNTSSEYAIYISSGHAGTSGNWILANNRIQGGETPIRTEYLGQYAAWVGNHFSGFNNQGCRIHYDTLDMWIEDNDVVNTSGNNQPLFNFQATAGFPGTDNPMERFRIFNNRYYAVSSDFNAGSVYRLGEPFGSANLNYPGWELRNNTWHDPTGPTTPGTWGSILIQNSYIRENEIRIGPGNAAYQTPPPAGDFGANR